MISQSIHGVEFLSSPLLPVPHGFSTRLGGVSEGHLASLNLGCRRGDSEEALRENYRRFCAATGTDVSRVVMANQVHGLTVRLAREGDIKSDLLAPTPFEADGLVTDCPGVTLVVFSADCVPILLCDPVQGVVAAVHAGWRGAAGGIVQVAVEQMVRRCGCWVEHIRAAIGPAIGPCCFDVHADVTQALLGRWGKLVSPFISPAPEASGGGPEDASRRKYRVDLKEINAALLRDLGVEQVDVSQDCTCCLPQRYWSHRFTRGVRGSQGAVIMKEG